MQLPTSKTYAAPELKIYGPVADLTASGKSATIETGPKNSCGQKKGPRC